MADLTVTAANVRPFDGATTKQVQANTAITAGQLVYKNLSASSKYDPADSSAAASALLAGIALTNATSAEYLIIQTGGEVNPGATVGVGQWYTASTNAGGIAPEGDVGTGSYPSLFGLGIATNKILMAITNTSTAHA